MPRKIHNEKINKWRNFIPRHTHYTSNKSPERILILFKSRFGQYIKNKNNTCKYERLRVSLCKSTDSI